MDDGDGVIGDGARGDVRVAKVARDVEDAILLGGPQVGDGDLMAGREQGTHHSAADEARPSRDEDAIA